MKGKYTFEVEIRGNDVLHIKLKLPADSLEQAIHRAFDDVAQITIEQFVSINAKQLGL